MRDCAGVTDYEIRRIGPDEARPVADTVRAALLGGAISDEDAEWGRQTWAEGRFLAAFEGDRCIGHVGSFDGDSTVPGGARLRTAGVTRVGVLPTHTRRGLLTTLMTRLLDQEHEAGSVVATLWASETAIYGRFGFGHASNTQSIAIDAAAARPLSSAPIGSTRLLDRSELDDVVPALYDRVARWRPGSMSRQAWMWDRSLKAARKPASRNTSPGAYVAVHSDARGVDDGYVHYEVSWTPRRAGKIVGTGTVHDLWAADARTETELWRYLLGIDLVATWHGEAQPVDEATRHVLADGRAYGITQRFDELWLRILDVDAALSARRYGPANESVVIGVADERFAANTGAWRISASGATRADAEPDVVVDIATLSATYLGGMPWSELRDAGIVSADAPVVLLDALFVEHPGPYCGTEF